VKHLLIDENLPASLASLLPGPSSHATDLGVQPSDHDLWEHARKEGWVILTRDTDFFDRIILHGPPPKVVWVRLGNMRRAALEAHLVQLWASIVRLLETADLVEVHPDALEALKREDPAP
jgi:predicted nuclease of predicted toxin-antitoxin system